jgi:hypothetical protein
LGGGDRRALRRCPYSGVLNSNLLQQVAVAAEDACPSELSNVATKRFSHGTNERHDEHTVTAFEKNFSD